MTDLSKPYIESCPVGCQSSLEDSDIILKQGPLRQCTECGQLTNPCTEALYWESMKEFDDPKGTWPTGKSAKRLLRHTKQLVTRIECFLGMGHPVLNMCILLLPYRPSSERLGCILCWGIAATLWSLPDGGVRRWFGDFSRRGQIKMPAWSRQIVIQDRDTFN